MYLELPAKHSQDVPVADTGGQLHKVLAHSLKELRVLAAQRAEGLLCNPVQM